MTRSPRRPRPGDFEFVGFVEGGDIPGDRVDVIVTDGFTGNIALKTGEGTAKLISDFLREAFNATFLSKIAALLALTSLKRLQKRIDPRRVNGGVFLGLNGTVVKSHGSADATGVSAAIKLAFQLAQSGFRNGLRHGLHPPGARGRMPARMGADDRWKGDRMTIRAVVKGVGHYLPERVVPNSEFEAIVETTDEWIRSRSGIERRHFAAEGQTTSDLATRAARRRWPMPG